MKTVPKLTIVALALATLILAYTSAADTLYVGNTAYRDVKVVGLRSGRLYYTTRGGQERALPIEQIKGMELDAYPDLAKADAAFAAEEFVNAAKLLSPIVEKAREEHVQILAGAKLVVCLDRSGQFTEAARRYAALLAIHVGPLSESARPHNFPKEPAQRQEAAKTLGDVLKTTRDPLAKQFLEKTIEALKSDDPMPGDGEEFKPRSGLLATAEEQKNDPLMQLIDADRAEEALQQIDQRINSEGGSLARLLYLRGRALAALGRDQEALLAYMRVVVHYSARTTAEYGPSLIESGKLFARAGKVGHARKLWTEARALYEKGSVEAGEIEKMIAELPTQ